MLSINEDIRFVLAPFSEHLKPWTYSISVFELGPHFSIEILKVSNSRMNAVLVFTNFQQNNNSSVLNLNPNSERNDKVFKMLKGKNLSFITLKATFILSVPFYSVLAFFCIRVMAEIQSLHMPCWHYKLTVFLKKRALWLFYWCNFLSQIVFINPLHITYLSWVEFFAR